MPRIFVSYVRENAPEVQRLARDLRSYGIDVWIDKEQIPVGTRWADEIRKGISKGDFFMACFSQEYAAKNVSYMNEELIQAIEQLRRRPTDRTWFIPVLFSPCEIPDRSIGASFRLFYQRPLGRRMKYRLPKDLRLLCFLCVHFVRELLRSVSTRSRMRSLRSSSMSADALYRNPEASTLTD
jgi:TIR domain